MMLQKQIDSSLERSYRLSNSFLFLDYISHMPGQKKSGKRDGKRKN